MELHRIRVVILAALAAAFPGWSNAASSPDRSRGEMLYSTHCIACHTEQVHWRDNRLAENWRTLAAQVRRWQSNEKLHWTDDDIRAVTRYLNTLYYHFPEDEKTASSGVAKKP